MSDLIKREDAMQAIADYEFPWCKDVEPVHLVYGMGTAMKIIEKIPAVDVVEVVRCSQCLHWKKDVAGCTDFIGRCEWANYFVEASGFCVYSERREDNEID